MTGRRSQRSETISTPLALLSLLRPARAALLLGQRNVRVNGPTYEALGAVVDAMHALAKHLGHPDHFLDDLHRTP